MKIEVTGNNPLLIHASGKVTIDGELNASGKNGTNELVIVKQAKEEQRLLAAQMEVVMEVLLAALEVVVLEDLFN